jgi:hypothetical protein
MLARRLQEPWCTRPCEHFLRDDVCRLFGVYEASNAKEHAAASKVLIARQHLSHPAYVKLLGDLRASGWDVMKTGSQSNPS